MCNRIFYIDHVIKNTIKKEKNEAIQKVYVVGVAE
jgi:hypothetical protein